MIYRKATMEDIPLLITLRKKQLIDEGLEPSPPIDKEMTVFFEEALRSETLVQWLVFDGDQAVGSGGVLFYQFPPSFSNPSGKQAYIANMYTEKNYRGKGIASTFLEKLIAEVKDAGIEKIWLGASIMGKPVYEKFGFSERDGYMEMRI